MVFVFSFSLSVVQILVTLSKNSVTVALIFLYILVSFLVVLSVHLFNPFQSFLFIVLPESFSGYSESDPVHQNVIKVLHIALLFDYGYKDTAVFSYFQIFLNFFYTFFQCLRKYIYIQVFPFCPCSSLFRWCVPCPVVCVLLVRSWSPDNHTHAHTYTRTRTRTRIFRP